MDKIFECIDNGGFEDQLTVSNKYIAVEVKNNSVKVQNAKGQKRWYGQVRFVRHG